ncbi:MAG: hypothetical protein GX445_05530 [Elusimicrobia bacterium]|nr:hypothetical protein [Elusimicrobiota bacterium]
MRYDILFDDITKIVESRYPLLGINKKREIKRLIFEIIKKKRIVDFSFIPQYKNYEQFKKELLKIRYQNSYFDTPSDKFYIPKLELSAENSFIKRDKIIDIDEVIVERGSENSRILSNILKKFPSTKVRYIDNFKNLKRSFDIKEYNSRSQRIYLFNERFDFIKRCPCTKGCLSCGYYVMNLGFGCPLDCEYCFLQGYQNFDGIALETNINDFISELFKLNKNKKNRIRIGTGEFTDSLVYDDLTEYSMDIINAIKDVENIYFEFKTKTTNINNFFKVKPSKNIVISYSLNPQSVIDKTEHYTSSLKERVKSLRSLLDYGYSTAIHLDPIISVEGWESSYSNMISFLFSIIKTDELKWISIGTFRFKPRTKKIIEQRFMNNIILDEEMVLDFDNKLRYPKNLRKDIYLKIIDLLKIYKFPTERIYLCMEDTKMWNSVGLKPNFIW